MGEEHRHYEQMDKRIDDTVKRVENEAQTNKEFRADTRAKLHKVKGTVGTIAEQVAEHERDLRSLPGLAERLEETAHGLRDLTEQYNLQGKGIDSLVEDLSAIAKDFKDALGHDGWVLLRLKAQDEKWTRIYFTIIGFLVSVITLTVTLWLGTKGGR